MTLDNFYDSGEQSSTGWTWTTTGRVPDLLEKTASVKYAKRGLAYEAEEADRSTYRALPLAARLAANPKVPNDPDYLPGPALPTAPDEDKDDEKGQGFLWNAAIRAGLSVRNYGFSDASTYDQGAPGDVAPLREPAKRATLMFPLRRADSRAEDQSDDAECRDQGNSAAADARGLAGKRATGAAANADARADPRYGGQRVDFSVTTLYNRDHNIPAIERAASGREACASVAPGQGAANARRKRLSAWTSDRP